MDPTVRACTQILGSRRIAMPGAEVQRPIACAVTRHRTIKALDDESIWGKSIVKLAYDCCLGCAAASLILLEAHSHDVVGHDCNNSNEFSLSHVAVSRAEYGNYSQNGLAPAYVM